MVLGHLGCTVTLLSWGTLSGKYGVGGAVKMTFSLSLRTIHGPCKSMHCALSHLAVLFSRWLQSATAISSLTLADTAGQLYTTHVHPRLLFLATAAPTC